MLIKYLITFSVFLGIDFIWLAFIARKFYQSQIGNLMLSKPNFLAAGIFYLLFVLGLLILVIQPALEKNSISQAITYAALFGLVSYATYDLTNLATLKDWPLLVTVTDLIWGTFLSSSVAAVSFFIIQKIV